MKLHKSNPFSTKVSVALATPVIILLALAIISLYDVDVADCYRYIRRAASSFSSPSSSTSPGTCASSSSASSSSSSSTPPPPPAVGACDVTRGEWVPDTEPPYYTNMTCPFIDDLQNCMKFSKPSLEFLRWRWQPDGCDLPRFDAARFLEAMRGKSMAFVGDSLARNHVKSLLCILSKVALPVEVGTAPEIDVTGRAVRRDYRYAGHNFTVSLFWSPFLVKANLSSNATLGLGQWDLHLDTPDARWAAHVVLSSTNWFFRPSVYYDGGRAVACNGGGVISGAHDVTELPVSHAVHGAARYCHERGVDAVRETEAEAQRNGVDLLLLDITEAMALRPDGHPSRYGHPLGGTVEGSFVPHKINPPSPKRSAAIGIPIIALLLLALVLLYDLTFSNSYYPRIARAVSSSSLSLPTSPANATTKPSWACDITKGEWVPDAEPPYYTNLTCPFIDDHQNCMKFGKPSFEFLRWRWRPDGCELPRFDAALFLEAMRGKSVAFVGDSLARNHFKSLLCLLSQEAQPVEVGSTPEIDPTGRAVRRDFRYGNHDFTATLFWSPFLVKANLTNETLGQWDIHLDAADARWAAHVAEFDYVVLSDTNWFLRRAVFREGGQVVGRNSAAGDGDLRNLTEVPANEAVKAAFRTALGAIAATKGFRGKVVVRTVTPAHFENGEWNTGGDCVRTLPFRRDERTLGAVEADFRAAQLDAVRETEAAFQRNGAELLVLDITDAMDLRPDGHPSRYGHPPGGSVEGTFVVDCLHWCLPGPIDLWNELLFQMLAAPH
ncbi:hypothetical protein PR202_gb09681 [Eleusine coracana subsp. coracana]|uniref:Trichome birefringence-like N-terminal domain-containing protein n=1 Tax=Eleusine coracana subsp. coracana TaxID=191504 RepID=A0AAV5EH76_ELECO|nr:hypothetical protein PR202_gb09681 [Eleusine coracana subsp. coracana]